MASQVLEAWTCWMFIWDLHNRHATVSCSPLESRIGVAKAAGHPFDVKVTGLMAVTSTGNSPVWVPTDTKFTTHGLTRLSNMSVGVRYTPEEPIPQVQLIGFSRFPEPRVVLFVLFLLMYLVTLPGNTVIMVVIRVDRSLYVPMYVFLGALSFSQICYCYTFSITPKMLSGLVLGSRAISFLGCAAQMHFSFMFGFMHSFLLAAMGYDRYVAICHPLRYNTVMTPRVCTRLVVASWAGRVFLGLLVTGAVFQFPFCQSHRIDHFFCHLSPILQLACVGDDAVGTVLNALCIATLLCCSLFILLTYAFMLGRILQVPSAEGRCKAFSTCASRVTVVVVHYSGASVVYLKHGSPSAAGAGALIDMAYTVFTPFLSPIIFSRRNRDLTNAFWKSLRKSFVIRNANVCPGWSFSGRSGYC
ncbi:olfactory receptor 10H1-like [Struthio camelus]|uniref:olfactory receptor 10H1-like n=1 Tax=Struthio camelus TaxID=8801 RepID=UPI003604131A